MYLCVIKLKLRWMENITNAPIEKEEIKYAGFWLRFVAFLVDSLILKVIHTIIFTPLFVFIGLSSFVKFGTEIDSTDEIPPEMLPFIITLIGGIIFAIFFSMVMFWLYYALMESSSKQATLGKMILNLKVTDLNGNRISFAQASGRYFGKIISSILFMIGYIMAGFTNKKQALHDMMSDCLVVKN